MSENSIECQWDHSQEMRIMQSCTTIEKMYWSTSSEQARRYLKGHRFMHCLNNFFEAEKIEEIWCISGANMTNFELRIVWKFLVVELRVRANKMGIVTYQFCIPDKNGEGRLRFKKEMIPTFDKLINLLNIKKTTSVAAHLINFKRNTQKHIIETLFTVTNFNEESEDGKIGPPEEMQTVFKKLCYMIFSNSLLRIKANLHLFHFLMKYPSLTVEEALARNEIQLKSLSILDWSMDKKSQEKKTEEKQTKKQRHKGHTQEALVADRLMVTGQASFKAVSISKTYLGRGGFGEVLSSRFTNK